MLSKGCILINIRITYVIHRLTVHIMLRITDVIHRHTVHIMLRITYVIHRLTMYIMLFEKLSIISHYMTQIIFLSFLHACVLTNMIIDIYLTDNFSGLHQY